MKKIFSKVIYDDKELLGSNIQKLELKYYKTRKNLNRGYGIEITKKELCNNRSLREKRCYDNITLNEKIVNRLLEVLSVNKVTPVASDDVISDFLKEFNKVT